MACVAVMREKEDPYCLWYSASATDDEPDSDTGLDHGESPVGPRERFDDAPVTCP